METFIKFIEAMAPQTPELRFLLAAAAVIAAGTRLSRYGGVFSAKLKVGEVFVGLIFMSFATALPELVTSASAAAVQNSPNMAIGNNFGNIFFNIAILAGLDLLIGKKSLYSLVDAETMVPGALSLLLIAIAALSLAVELARPGLTPVIWNISLASIVIFAAYAGGAGFLRHHHEERAEKKEGEAEDEYKTASLGWTIVKYAAAAAVILWAGVNLSKSGDDLSAKYSLSKSFVGTMLLALATSLPEISATISMVRKSMYSMAFGNIFGSNAFNVVIIAVVDVLYRRGSLFTGAVLEGTAEGTKTISEAAHVHLVTAALSTIMTAIIVIGVMHKPSSVRARLSWPSFLVLATFLLGALLTYLLGGQV